MKTANPTEIETAKELANQRLAALRKLALKGSARMRNWAVIMSIMFHILTIGDMWAFWTEPTPFGAIVIALLGWRSAYFILEYRKHRDANRQIKEEEWDDTLLDS